MSARIYIDTPMPDDLDDYGKENWINTTAEDLPDPPEGYLIVRSGITQVGDILGGRDFWDFEHVLESPKSDQVLNCEVNHFQAVARKTPTP